MTTSSRSAWACLLAVIALGPTRTKAQGLDGNSSRESPQARSARLDVELQGFERRHEIVTQRLEDLMRRRIAHDLLVALTEDEIVQGMPPGDPLQREALEKTLASAVDKSRKLRETLQSLRRELTRIEADNAMKGVAVRSPASIPASPGPGISVPDRGPTGGSTSRANETDLEPRSIPEDVRRFDLVPVAAPDPADQRLVGPLPFAFDEVARSIPAAATVVRTAPTQNVLRRTWALLTAGLARRALEVVRSTHPEEEDRPVELIFLEARALESLGLTDQAESIYAKIIERDQSAPAATGSDESSSAAAIAGPWARASRTALDSIRFAKRFPVESLPTTRISW